MSNHKLLLIFFTWINLKLEFEANISERSPSNQIIMSHSPVERIDKIINDKGRNIAPANS